MAGKTGADAIGKALHHVCHVFVKYDSKLRAVISAAVAAGAITSAQGTAANAFLDTVNVTCSIWEAIAEFNSITP